MNKLLLITLLLISTSVKAQTQLPPCQGTNPQIWNMCFGELINSKIGKYVGEFRNGMFNGKGSISYNDGGRIVGNFKDNKLNGYGSFKFNDGTSYVGEWKDDKKSGKGTFTFSNGDVYVGQFLNNLRNGFGTQTYSDSSKYEGEWRDGKYNGKGTLTTKDRQVKTGNWLDGNLIEKDKNLDLTKNERYCQNEFRKQGDNWGYEQCMKDVRIINEINAQKEIETRKVEAAKRAKQEEEQRKVEAEKNRTKNKTQQLNTTE